MENQHRKISGYRDLNQEEIDLMNEIKEKGRDLVALASRVSLMEVDGTSQAFQRERWSEQSIINIETGVMQLIRAVALPV